MISFLKWFFIPNGVVCRNRPPLPQEVAGYAYIGKPVMQNRCSVCGVTYWTWRDKGFCGKFSCFRKLGKKRSKK